MIKVRTDPAALKQFRDAITRICGKANPPRRCLDQVGQDAARLVKRARAWRGAWLYALLHLDTYGKRHNNGKIKYGIHVDLLYAVTKLASMEALSGRSRVTVYARGVREGAVILIKSRKCKRPSCRIHFVGRGDYCSDKCRSEYSKHLRKKAAEARRRKRLTRRRKGECARGARSRRRVKR